MFKAYANKFILLGEKKNAWILSKALDIYRVGEIIYQCMQN